MEKVGNYILSNLKDDGDIMPLFRKLENPITNFELKRMPKELLEDDKKSQVKQDIYKEKIKSYVTRECNLYRNIEKSFGIIWASAALVCMRE